MKSVLLLGSIGILLGVVGIIHLLGTIASSVVSYPSNPSVSTLPASTQQTAPNQQTSSTSPNVITTSTPITNASENWAGYVATQGTFTAVSGSWTIPKVVSSGRTSADATWVGIGGVKSTDLIQTGTEDIVSSNGQITTSAFYELLPASSQTITSLQVNPGDSITASISETSSNYWEIHLQDTTTQESFTTTVFYYSSLSSAEWIQEDPSNGVTQLPLDTFGNISFVNGTTTENGQTTIAGSDAQLVNMMNSFGQELATVSSLGTNGNSFSVTQNTTPVTTNPNAYQSNPFSRGWVRQGRGMSRFYSQY